MELLVLPDPHERLAHERPPGLVDGQVGEALRHEVLAVGDGDDLLSLECEQPELLALDVGLVGVLDLPAREELADVVEQHGLEVGQTRPPRLGSRPAARAAFSQKCARHRRRAIPGAGGAGYGTGRRPAGHGRHRHRHRPNRWTQDAPRAPRISRPEVKGRRSRGGQRSYGAECFGGREAGGSRRRVEAGDGADGQGGADSAVEGQGRDQHVTSAG